MKIKEMIKAWLSLLQLPEKMADEKQIKCVAS